MRVGAAGGFNAINAVMHLGAAFVFSRVVAAGSILLSLLETVGVCPGASCYYSRMGNDASTLLLVKPRVRLFFYSGY